MSIYGDSIFLNEGLISKYREKKEQKQKEKEAKKQAEYYEFDKEMVKKTADWIKSPYSLGDGYDVDILYIFCKAKSLEELCSFCVKNKSKFKSYNTKKEICNNEESSYRKYKKIVGDKCIEILGNDDYVLALGLDGKLYNLYTSDDTYSIAKESNFHSANEYSISSLKKADKELGTNLFKD